MNGPNPAIVPLSEKHQPARFMTCEDEDMAMQIMRRLALYSAVAVTAAVGGWMVPLAGAASESPARTVQGEIVAVNVTDSPPVIVVKTMSGKKEMVVGAAVESGAEILRGKQKVSLDSLKAGDKVTLTYVKKGDGLAARSIQAR
jgi:hypothetical protein